MPKNKLHKFLLGIVIFCCVSFFYKTDVNALRAILRYHPEEKKLSMRTVADYYANIHGAWAECNLEGNSTQIKVLFWGKDEPTNTLDQCLFNGAERKDEKDISDWGSGTYICKIIVQTDDRKNSEGKYTFIHKKGSTNEATNSNSGTSNNETSNNETSNNETSNNETSNNGTSNKKPSTLDCNSWGDAKKDLQNLFNFMKVLVPLLVIGLSTYDFIKAITQKDDKDIKKAFNRLIKRMVYAVILFFLPDILNLVLQMVEVNSGVCID